MQINIMGDTEDLELIALIEAVNDRYSYDFKDYSRVFIKRMVHKIMDIKGMKSIRELKKGIYEDRGLFELLFSAIAVNTTEMFRDPGFFRTVREEIIPYLKTYPFSRIWHAGCSTGEEVYSLAILLKEEGLQDRVRIYATDYSDANVRQAKEGVFPLRKLKQYTENYRKSGGLEEFSDYYISDSRNIMMLRELRENIVFARHNMVTDAVFGEMHVIFCRNLMIYFDAALQRKTVRMLNAGLTRKGFLCLGSRESSIDDVSGFEELKKGTKIYRKTHDLDTEQDFVCRGDKGTSALHCSSGKNAGSWKYDVVVIGVSAGGVKALKTILSGLSEGFRLPVIIVLHQDPRSESRLVEILDRDCLLRVKEAEDNEKISGGTVYIAPPDYHLLVERGGVLSLTQYEKVSYARPSIDVLFESASEEYRQRLIGVILTGATEDGTLGIRRVKEAGGAAVVQDPESAQLGIMPRSAAAHVNIDHILRLEEIAFQLDLYAAEALPVHRPQEGSSLERNHG